MHGGDVFVTVKEEKRKKQRRMAKSGDRIAIEGKRKYAKKKKFEYIDFTSRRRYLVWSACVCVYGAKSFTSFIIFVHTEFLYCTPRYPPNSRHLIKSFV